VELCLKIVTMAKFNCTKKGCGKFGSMEKKMVETYPDGPGTIPVYKQQDVVTRPICCDTDCPLMGECPEQDEKPPSAEA
jgi:hypothetical protein